MRRRTSVIGLKKERVPVHPSSGNTTGSSEHTDEANVKKDDTDTMKAFPLGMKEALIPFVFYRRSTSEKGWSYKSLNTVTKGIQSHEQDHVLTTIITAMVVNHVVPYHLMHIEHCRNCEDHAMTTRHVRVPLYSCSCSCSCSYFSILPVCLFLSPSLACYNPYSNHLFPPLYSLLFTLPYPYNYFTIKLGSRSVRGKSSRIDKLLERGPPPNIH